jgi:hypothetical protein
MAEVKCQQNLVYILIYNAIRRGNPKKEAAMKKTPEP